MNRLKRLFSDYARGKSTDLEKDIIDLWFKEKGKSSINLLTDDEVNQFSEKAWTQFSLHQKKVNRIRKSIITYGLTASVAVIIMLILNVFIQNNSISINTEIENSHEEMIVDKRFESKDKMKKITLADGSIVFMNLGSVISLRGGNFNDNTREIWLEEGEAFFDVIEDEKRPFIVHTADGLITKVLGTSFNIKAYSQLKEQVVSVVTGRVQVYSEKAGDVLLDVNHKAIYRPGLDDLNVEKTNGFDVANWRNGYIVLDHVTIDELKFRLNQYYNVSVENNIIPEEMEIYTSFHINTPLEHVVSNIANIFGISYRILDNSVEFY